MGALRAVVCCLPLAMAGCAFDAALPDELVVSCSSASPRCPPHMTCDEALGRCLRNEVIGVEASEIAPRRAKAGRLVTVRLTLTKQPASPPEIRFDRATSLAAVIAERVADDELAWEAQWVPAGDEPEGDVDVIALLSEPGGQRTRVRLGAVTLDFTPPGIIDTGALVSLMAAPDNLIDSPSAVRGDTVTRLSFATTEPVTAVAQSNPDLFDLTLVASRDSLSFIFEGRLRSSAPDGPVRFEALLADEALNESLVSLGAPVLVDVTAPPSPDVDAGLTLHRAPWGRFSTDGGPWLELEVAPGAVETGLTVTVFDPATALPLAHARVDDEAGLKIRLPGGDATSVVVTATDGAGNSSAPVRTVRSTWVASMGGKVLGDTLSNPHRAECRSFFGPELVDDSAREIAARALTMADGVVEPCAAAARWLRQSPTVTAPVASNAVWDAPRARALIVTGGRLQSVREGYAEPISGGPSFASSLFGLALDASRGRLIVVGDQTSFWQLDLASGLWLDLGSGPMIGNFVVGVAATYEPRSGEVLRCGVGLSSSVFECTVWVGTQWKAVAMPAGFPRSFSPTIDADQSTGRTILYGGSTGLLDTWAYQADAGWSEFPTRFTSSTASRFGALTWDSIRHKLVLLTGADAQLAAYQLDGVQWVSLGWPPLPLAGLDFTGSCPAAWHDPNRDEFVLVGQFGERQFVRADGQFRVALPAQAAPSTSCAAMGTTPAGNVILAGGPCVGSAPATSTFELTERGWLRKSSTSPNRSGAVLVPVGAEAVLVGGIPFGAGPPATDVLRWTGTDWQPSTTVPSLPNGLRVPSAAWSSTLQKLVVVGGLTVAGADNLTAYAWSSGQPSFNVEPAWPVTNRLDGAMVENPRGGALVFTGNEVRRIGASTLWVPTTLTFDGGTVSSSAAPGVAEGVRVATDGHSAYRFGGGFSSTFTFNDDPSVFELSPAGSWDAVPTQSGAGRPVPTVRKYGGFAWLPAKRRFVAHGGTPLTSSGSTSETWEFAWHEGRPALVVTFNLAARRIDASNIRATLRVVGDSAGSTVWAWRDRWVAVAQLQPATSMEPRVDELTLPSALFDDAVRRGSLQVAVGPTVDNELGPRVATVDGIELELELVAAP